MYLFRSLNRREKRLIIILTTTNLLILGLLFAGTRSYASHSASRGSQPTQVASESGKTASNLEILPAPMD